MLVLTPALEAIKNNFPEEHVTVAVTQRSNYGFLKSNQLINIATGEGTSEALINNPNVDEIIIINREYLRSLRGLKRFQAEYQIIKFFRKNKYDCVINAFPDDRFIILSFLAGVKIRVGQKRHGFSWLLTDKIEAFPNESNQLNYVLKLIEVLNIESVTQKTFFSIPEKNKQWVNNELCKLGISEGKNIITIHPGASKPDRIWPVKYFAELIIMISSLKDYEAVICSSSYDEIVVQLILNHLDFKVKVITITDSISNLAALFKRSQLVITNDSGPRHLSAAINVRSVSVFKRHNDKQWKIYPDELARTLEKDSACDLCPKDKCLIFIPEGEGYGAKCMWDITPSMVFEEIKKMI